MSIAWSGSTPDMAMPSGGFLGTNPFLYHTTLAVPQDPPEGHSMPSLEHLISIDTSAEKHGGNFLSNTQFLLTAYVLGDQPRFSKYVRHEYQNNMRKPEKGLNCNKHIFILWCGASSSNPFDSRFSSKLTSLNWELKKDWAVAKISCSVRFNCSTSFMNRAKWQEEPGKKFWGSATQSWPFQKISFSTRSCAELGG